MARRINGRARSDGVRYAGPFLPHGNVDLPDIMVIDRVPADL